MELQPRPQNEKPDAQSEDAAAVECVKSVRKWLKRFNDLMGDGGVASVTRNDVIIARERLLRECEQLMKYPKFRRQALETLWMNCWYGPVKIYRAALANLTDQHINWLRPFISCAIGHLSYLIEKCADLSLQLLVYVGDLNRYRYQVCGSQETDFDVAVVTYGKAVRMYPNEGNPVHQLALLYSGKDNRRALKLFLRSLLVEKPFKRAVDNLKVLKVDDFRDMDRVVFEITTLLLGPFNRIACDEHKDKLDEGVKTALEDGMDEDLLKSLYNFSLVSIYILNSEDMEEQGRYVSTFLCSIWQSLLASLAGRARASESPKQQAIRRRRRRRISEESDDEEAGGANSSDDQKHSNTDSDDEDETQFTAAVPVLTVVSEWLARVSEKFTAKKVTVAVRMQYHGLVQALIDALNKFLRHVSPLVTQQKDDAANLMKTWTLDAPILCTSEERLDALRHFLTQCIAGTATPIVFERFFKIASGQAKELDKMKTIGRAHSEHVNKEEAKKASLPLFVMPDQNVLTDRLSFIKSLIIHQTLVVVARKVLAELDRIKKDNLPVRNAIRWLETELKEGRVKVAEASDADMKMCAEKFLHSKGVNGQQSLFLTILVMEKEPKPSDNAAISVENADRFRERWTSHRRKDLTSTTGPT